MRPQLGEIRACVQVMQSMGKTIMSSNVHGQELKTSLPPGLVQSGRELKSKPENQQAAIH